MDAQTSWLALSLIPGLGGRVGKILLEEFGFPDRILCATGEDLEAIHGVGPRLAEAIRRGPDRERLQEELANVERAGARLLGIGEEGYPPLLRQIPDPPLVLYLLGRPLERDKPRIGMVGTRSATEGGLALSRDLARSLASFGVEVVSGLARGVDSASHLGALEGGGTTVAVLGCGIDVLYPLRKRDLRDRIAEEGTLVSEFPMRASPIPEFFPRRNRIISGLSSGVVVVEAGARSGALLTADLALDQGREVMAVPGSPRSRVSVGPNRLIQEGAKLVMSAADVLEELYPFAGDSPEDRDIITSPPEPDGPEELRIMRALASEASLVDDVAEKTGLEVSVVLERLLGMELRGLVRRTGGARYEQVSR